MRVCVSRICEYISSDTCLGDSLFAICAHSYCGIFPGFFPRSFNYEILRTTITNYYLVFPSPTIANICHMPATFSSHLYLSRNIPNILAPNIGIRGDDGLRITFVNETSLQRLCFRLIIGHRCKSSFLSHVKVNGV